MKTKRTMQIEPKGVITQLMALPIHQQKEKLQLIKELAEQEALLSLLAQLMPVLVLQECSNLDSRPQELELLKTNSSGIRAPIKLSKWL